MRRRRGQADLAGAQSRRRLAGEQRRAAEARGASQHQHMAHGALVSIAGTRRQPRLDQLLVEQLRRRRQIGMLTGIDAQGTKMDLTGQRGGAPGMQADLVADEGDGAAGPYGHAELRPGVGGQAAGNVDGQHRQPAGIDRLDGLAESTAHLAAEPGAEQRVDDHFTVEGDTPTPRLAADAGCRGHLLGPCGIALEFLEGFYGDTLHRHACHCRQRRQHMAIAAIVAATAQHADTLDAGPARPEALPGSGGGALHQGEALDSPRDGAPVELTHLFGTIQRAQHDLRFA